MEFSELLSASYLAYRGKIAAKTPAFGTDKANIVLALANRLQRQWAKDSKQHWSSLFETRNVTPVIGLSTFSYNLDVQFMTPAKHFIVTKTNGDDIKIYLSKPQMSDCKAYIAGNNPKTINFVTIDPVLNGGILKAPAYYLPDTLVNATDDISVDDPNWLVYAVAAELARNDPAQMQQFPTLMGIANDLYQKMIDANNDLGYMQNNTIPNKMPQISPDLNQDEAFI